MYCDSLKAAQVAHTQPGKRLVHNLPCAAVGIRDRQKEDRPEPPLSSMTDRIGDNTAGFDAVDVILKYIATGRPVEILNTVRKRKHLYMTDRTR
jgi:hypothetical protein